MLSSGAEDCRAKMRRDIIFNTANTTQRTVPSTIPARSIANGKDNIPAPAAAMIKFAVGPII